MRSSAILTLAAALISVSALPVVRAQDKPTPKSAASERFDRFKSLEGEWVAKSDSDHLGGDVKVTYHVTSGGSAVTETIGAGTEHEMVTVITKDGDNVALTHYCMLGNQPHMKAPATGSGNSVAFKYASCGNMKSDMDTHMHNVTYTFIDKDNLKTEWTLYDKGKATGTTVFMLKRSKA